MEIKEAERLLSDPFYYVGENDVYLEIADYRLFADPYGIHHPGAIGKIFKFRGERVSYIKLVEPYVFDKKIGDTLVPIHVYSQIRVNEDIVLLVRIENRLNSPRLYDFHKHNGTWLHIVLYPEKYWTAKQELRPKQLVDVNPNENISCDYGDDD